MLISVCTTEGANWERSAQLDNNATCKTATLKSQVKRFETQKHGIDAVTKRCSYWQLNLIWLLLLYTVYTSSISTVRAFNLEFVNFWSMFRNRATVRRLSCWRNLTIELMTIPDSRVDRTFQTWVHNPIFIIRWRCFWRRLECHPRLCTWCT